MLKALGNMAEILQDQDKSDATNCASVGRGVQRSLYLPYLLRPKWAKVKDEIKVPHCALREIQ